MQKSSGRCGAFDSPFQPKCAVKLRKTTARIWKNGQTSAPNVPFAAPDASFLIRMSSLNMLNFPITNSSTSE